ncbi:MAG: helix-turn-helix domain-containing protein [Candidatus Methylopumilus sp.]
MSNLEYNGQVLAEARREKKLKADDIAIELCLTVQQVQAIENNLNAFFHSNKLKQAVIKRYCHLLNIDVSSVISQYEIDVTDNTFKAIKKDSLNKRLKKYFYISMAAFITTVIWKFFA